MMSSITVDEVGSKLVEIVEKLVSPKIDEVLRFLKQELARQSELVAKENEARKKEINANLQDLQDRMDEVSRTLEASFRTHCDQREARLKELIHANKKTAADLKRDLQALCDRVEAENGKRMFEAESLKTQMEREKRELQDYLERDTHEMRRKIEIDNKILLDKLDRDSAIILDRMDREYSQRDEERQALEERLQKDKCDLARQLEKGSRDLGELLTLEEEERRRETEKLRAHVEAEKKMQGNEITQMFDRLRAENEQRKSEVHGLKDVLVRENDNRVKEMQALRSEVMSHLDDVSEKVEKGLEDGTKRCGKAKEGLNEAFQKHMREVEEKFTAQAKEFSQQVELTANDVKDKMQMDKKALTNVIEEECDERRRDMQLLKAQIFKDTDQMKGQIEADAQILLQQLQKDSADIMNTLRRERSEREKDFHLLRDKMDKEKREIQIGIDKDRDSFIRKLKEEHDLRRLEQVELLQKLDDLERSGKADLTDLQQKLKREVDARDVENEEICKTLKEDRQLVDDRLMQERQFFREALESECVDLNRRLEKLNVERLNDCAEIQAKVAMLGKSASRHIDNLKHYIFRECQSLFDLATKPCSVIFNCHREESYFNGGEDYLTFSGCTVNIGNGMNPKSGEFLCPEAGLYMFLVTCCTYDMKKCLLALRKNGKDVANLFDQDGDENKGKTMLAQNILLELVADDKVQIYAYTSTGLTDTRTSHYTQFIGMLLRPSVESMHEVVCRLGINDMDEADLDDDRDVRSHSIGLRGTNSGIGSRRDSRKSRRKTSRDEMLMSPPPIIHVRGPLSGRASRERSITPSLATPGLTPSLSRRDSKRLRNSSLHSSANSIGELSVKTVKGAE